MDFKVVVGETVQLETSVDGGLVNQGVTYALDASAHLLASITAGGLLSAIAPGVIIVKCYDSTNTLIKSYLGICETAAQRAYEPGGTHTITADAFTGGGAVATPANFTGAYGSSGMVVFSWSASANASGYRLYNAITGAVLATIPGGTTTTTVMAGVGSYNLTAMDASGLSSTPATLNMV